MSWWSVLVERISYCSLLQLYFLGGRGRLTLSSRSTPNITFLCYNCMSSTDGLGLALRTVLGRPQQAVEQSIQWLKKKMGGNVAL